MLERIGAGGMSTVYAGEHTTLRRPVAIKVLHRTLATQGTMARRMVAEAFTIAALHHPGIVSVLDVGVTDDGRSYVVMERLVGESLAARLGRGRLSEGRVIVFARQLASALAAAHGAGVIHRDLKPENLFVIPDPDVPGGERLKVLDFGIAKRDVDGRERTLTGVVLGTPAYMAPEQLDGSADLDGRADIYALGVVIYQMVTGVLPFSGESTAEVIAQQGFCAPAPASSLAPVSAQLSAIIERCLAKRPSGRYGSMDELVLDLGRVGPPIPVLVSFDQEDTDVDRAGRRGAATPVFVPATSTLEETSPMVARAPRRRRWLQPVVIAGALAVGVAAAYLPRRWPGAATDAREPAGVAAPAAASTRSEAPATPPRQPGRDVGAGVISDGAAPSPAPTRSEPAARAAVAARDEAPPAPRRRPPARAREATRRPARHATNESPRTTTTPAAAATTEDAFARIDTPTLY